LDSLFQKTWKDHPDYALLEKALEKMKTTAQYVNNNAKAADNVRKLVLIDQSLIGMKSSLVAPSRTFVKEGHLMQFTKGQWKKKYFFLFNDLLVRARPNRSQKDLTYTFMDKFPLSNAIFTRTPDTSHIKDEEHPELCFSISQGLVSYMIQCTTPEEKDDWSLVIEKILAELHEKEIEGVRTAPIESTQPTRTRSWKTLQGSLRIKQRNKSDFIGSPLSMETINAAISSSNSTSDSHRSTTNLWNIYSTFSPGRKRRNDEEDGADKREGEKEENSEKEIGSEEKEYNTEKEIETTTTTTTEKEMDQEHDSLIKRRPSSLAQKDGEAGH